MKHTKEEARYLVQYGNSGCTCENCYGYIEGLGFWLSNSDLTDTYTEDDAIADFWAEEDEAQ